MSSHKWVFKGAQQRQTDEHGASEMFDEFACYECGTWAHVEVPRWCYGRDHERPQDGYVEHVGPHEEPSDSHFGNDRDDCDYVQVLKIMRT